MSGLADDSVIDKVTETAETGFIQGSVSDYWALMRESCEFFLNFFLAEELVWDIPLFHKQIWNRLIDLNPDFQRVLLAIPREHSKTTLAKLCVVWYFMFTNHKFCIYLSNTSPIAKNACRDIISYLRSENFERVFGKIKMEKESETDGLWIFDLPLPNGKWKRCILRSAGANQQMRGINIYNQRPDIAVVDDLEDKENTATPTLQKKLDGWVFGTFLKALSKKSHKVIWLGNMLEKTSLLARLSMRPNWNPVVFGALIPSQEDPSKLVPLWPDLWSLEALIADFREYADMNQLDTWMCEMMNMPGHGANGFTTDDIVARPVPLPEDCVATFITIDPAFGLVTELHDKTAIVVHALLRDETVMVVDYEIGNYTEHQMFMICLRKSIYWGSWVWGIESVAAQSVLVTLFRTLASLQRLENRIRLCSLKSGRGDPKAGRIKAWVKSMPAGLYAIPLYAYELVMQILNYDLTKKEQEDDLIDGCAYGLIMLESYRKLILTHKPSNDNEQLEARYGMEVSSV